jgi:2-C-methyl-D-erythritol 4-phosphate cytidylyltransferase
VTRAAGGGRVGLWGVIPAAGIGRRMGTGMPKQYLRIAGRTLLEHAAAALLATDGLQRLVIAHHRDDSTLGSLPLAMNSRVQLVVGGDERAESVLAAVEALTGLAADDDWVIVHDAARPCIQPGMIQMMLEELADSAVGGILAQPLSDTVKQADATGAIDKTLPRERLWRAQTPQVFRYRALLEALRNVAQGGVCATDEAMAMERMGHRPRLIEGPASNIKVTFPEDLTLATWYLEQATEREP